MYIVDTSASFTRPSDTTAYTAGDLIANSTTNTLVVPMFFPLPAPGFKIFRASVKFNDTTTTNAKFRLHLYKSKPTVSNGDNGAWLSIEARYQGAIDIDASTLSFSDSTKAFGIYTNTSLTLPMYCVADPAIGGLYGLLAATAAYTPTSAEIFSLGLHGEAYS